MKLTKPQAAALAALYPNNWASNNGFVYPQDHPGSSPGESLHEIHGRTLQMLQDKGLIQRGGRGFVLTSQGRALVAGAEIERAAAGSYPALRLFAAGAPGAVTADDLMRQARAALAELDRYREALEHIAAGNISPAVTFAQLMLDGNSVQAAHTGATVAFAQALAPEQAHAHEAVRMYVTRFGLGVSPDHAAKITQTVKDMRRWSAVLALWELNPHWRRDAVANMLARYRSGKEMPVETPAVSNTLIMMHPGLRHAERSQWLDRFNAASPEQRAAIIQEFSEAYPLSQTTRST